MFIKSKANN